MPRFDWRHAGRDVPFRQKIDMLLNFFRHLSVAAILAKQSQESEEPSAKSLHILLASGENEIDSLGDAKPMLLFRRELFAAGRGQFVIARFAIVVGHAPFRLDPALRFQSVKRRIKRTLLDVQNIFRHLLDPVRDSEAVSRIVLERFQDQHVERAVNKVWFFFCHNVFDLDSLGEWIVQLFP